MGKPTVTYNCIGKNRRGFKFLYQEVTNLSALVIHTESKLNVILLSLKIFKFFQTWAFSAI